MKNRNGHKIGSRIRLYKKDLGIQLTKIVKIFILTIAIIFESFVLPIVTKAAVILPYNPTTGNYTISTAAHLVNFATDVNAGNTYASLTVVLGNSIDMTDQQWSGIGTIGTGSADNQFVGTFDGNNYIISNLGVKSDSASSSCAKNGLFVNNNGTIKNVRLNNVNVIGINSYVGGIAGQSTGAITNCYVISGQITGQGNFIGGICGKSLGANITKCYNSARIKSNCTSTIAGSQGNGTGGICGWFSRGTLSNCYNTTTISSSNSTNINLNIGGIVGYLSNNNNTSAATTTIQNCYNLGNVSATNSNSASGIAGTAEPLCSISSCYNAGQVTGAKNTYAISYPIPASTKAATVNNCYYDSNVCSAKNIGATGRSTKDLKSLTQTLFTGFTKASSDLINNGYPVLSAFTATATTITSSTAAATLGELVTFTATISKTSVNTISHNEQVDFYDGTTLICQSTAANGVATFSTSNLPAGTHKISALYVGDTTNLPGTSIPITLKINDSGSASSSINLTSLNTNTIDSVTFQATLSSSSCTGQVIFLDGGTLLSFIPIINGVATLTLPALPVGEHKIKAVYLGNSTYMRSESNILLSSTTTLASSAGAATTNTPLTFTATINSATPIPDKALVTIYDRINNNTSALDSQVTSNGVATFSKICLSSGVHFITANYIGDETHIPSTSTPVCIIVGDGTNPPPTITLTSANTPNCLLPANYSPTENQVTFTASISISNEFDGEQIIFWDNSKSIGTSTISNGHATCSYNFKEIGTHTITATYSGTNSYAGTSASLAQTIIHKITLNNINDGKGGQVADLTPINNILSDPSFQKSTVVVNVTQPGVEDNKSIINADGTTTIVPIITSDMLSKLQTLHSTLVLQILNPDGTTRYIWKLDGDKFDDVPYADLNVNLLISDIGQNVLKSNPDLLKSNSDLLKGVVLNFANDGIIPCSTISINLSSMKLSNDTTTSIYIYLLKPDNNIDVSTESIIYFDNYGFITLDFTHNSNYILTTQQLSNKGKNTNLTIIILISSIALIFILILLLRLIILRRKKKINSNLKSLKISEKDEK